MRYALVLTLALTTWAAAPVDAAVCALDVAPARTLLLPYFEVDLAKLDKPKKTEITTVTLTNHADAQALVHVTFWTDLSRPVMAYDIAIAPFGSQDVPLHEIFSGDVEDLPGRLEGTPIAPPGVTTEDIIARQTGRELDSGECLTFPRGDNRARGYVTFDVNDANDGVFPSARANPRGRTDHLNLITGVVRYNNRKRKYGALEHLVHLELTEGLGYFWAADYDIGSGSSTTLVVWREPPPIEGEFDGAAVCDGPSENGWYPLGQMGITVADPAGNMQDVLLDTDEGGAPGFPLVSGAYELGKGNLKLPYKSGTIYLDLSDSERSWVGIRRSFNATKRQGRTQAIPVVPIECADGADSFRKKLELQGPPRQKLRLKKGLEPRARPGR